MKINSYLKFKQRFFFSWKRMLLHLLIITYAAIAQQSPAVLVS